MFEEMKPDFEGRIRGRRGALDVIFTNSRDSRASMCIKPLYLTIQLLHHHCPPPETWHLSTLYYTLPPRPSALSTLLLPTLHCQQPSLYP